ncbi:DEAD/DEAH box helicase [Paenisporosarcina quisquiliarum]|uniref:DEAD/DEAH box helicase n=1 Tax=Paenisporosarcina quisquiliarum TaxID=365346 RepID=A0A9X3RDX5_9BACL|nr:DEAD/DEAH box helicase [Paenisporosarcina quisquiliarum]MCZ8537599.1 DEAD/DEAH box helicase [Paenisporosarcina quisquiliarum]
MGEFLRNLEESLHKGFINQNFITPGSYKPQLLVNNTIENENVLSTLLDELEHCETFLFSVAFITESGLATLKAHFHDLNLKGIEGRILTSTFLQFNQPKVFKELLKIENVQVRLSDIKGFHSKGYIFQHPTHYSLIVGSSNLTSHALKVNYEWNVKLTTHENGEIIHHFKNQFEHVWGQSQDLSPEWIEEYEKVYVETVEKRKMEKVIEGFEAYQINNLEDALKIIPNKMQTEALLNIASLRTEKDKGLIISATGTGKTYLSAFDVRNYAPQKMLFVVHREQILQKAKSDFKRILGGYDDEFGILSGTTKDTNAKYLFATIQSLSKDSMLSQFKEDEFDYILIDEVHKAGADSYRKVINYFKPKFLMGMTATPERTDSFNIYELFDFNVAYEIRLQQALEEDMLCPFHYFGVTDLEINGESIDDAALFSKLVTDERVNHIIDKIEYYGYSGESVKGLMFCSGIEEARELSRLLNEKGYRTIALIGADSPEERIKRVEQLENGELDYILTVDIFNEGIDIPSVNQVVMLRQTQSSIIFIQQLGRGLRKHESKDFVTIIDFIGNYKNNYLIPVALSGDQSQNKDNIRRKLNDTSYIKGISTVIFEGIAKDQIYKSINNTKLTQLKLLKDAFEKLKNRIGHIPYLYDFVINESLDPVAIVSEHDNYYAFLKKIKQEIPQINDYQKQVLTMFSQEILNGKRKHELLLIQLLIQSGSILVDDFKTVLIDNNCRYDDATLESVYRVLDLSFFTSGNRKKYGSEPLIIKKDQRIQLNQHIKDSINNNAYFLHLLEDIIKSGLLKSIDYDCQEKLTLFKKYSRKDACKLLNWNQDETSTMYGYKIKHQTCPIFVTYHKHDEVESSVAYGDEFIDQNLFKWYTRSNRTLESQEVNKIINAQKNDTEIHFFVKKDNGEGNDFYYLGEVKLDPNSVAQEQMKDKNGKTLPVVTMNMQFEKPVNSNLYHYLRSETIS